MELADIITVIMGDIVEQKVDAIVNAANNSLLGGGGVDGAIHAAAGPQLLEECKNLGGCRTGEAKITKGYLLPAQWVIHTVGPIWKGGNLGEDKLLNAAYRNSLNLAEEHGIKSIAFPGISIGAYGYPVKEASGIAVNAVIDHLRTESIIEELRLVCYNEDAFNFYSEAFEGIIDSIENEK